jgi:hypothetical protein
LTDTDGDISILGVRKIYVIVCEISDARSEFEAYANEFYWAGQHVVETLVEGPVVEENCQ